MSNNILEPIPTNLNDYLLKYQTITLSATTPPAPNGSTNVTFQMDGYGNISAYATTPTGGGSVGTAGQIQKVGATAGSFAASSLTDNGTDVTVAESLFVGASGLRLVDNGGGTSSVVFDGATNSTLITTDGGSNIEMRAGSGGSVFFFSGGGFFAGISPTTATLPGLSLNSSVETSATAGTASPLPALPAGYFDIQLSNSGQTFVKVPYYLP